MSWKDTENFVYCFENSFIRLTNKIQTANARGEQLSWKNHRKWYVQLVKENKNILRKLKKILKNENNLFSTLNGLESSMSIIYDIDSDTKVKWDNLQICTQTFTQFKKELDKRMKEDYDVFVDRDFEIDKKLCFVLMPFDAKFKSVYTKAIKPAVKRAKLNPKRADEIFIARPIIQDIWEYINKSVILVADLTDRNPNVFYEVGLSHAVPKRLVIISQKKEDVPFDLQHIRWIKYTNTPSGIKDLTKKLYRAINAGLS